MGIGLMFAIFHCSGITPVYMEAVNNLDKGSAMNGERAFKNHPGISSMPGAVFLSLSSCRKTEKGEKRFGKVGEKQVSFLTGAAYIGS